MQRHGFAQRRLRRVACGGDEGLVVRRLGVLGGLHGPLGSRRGLRRVPRLSGRVVERLGVLAGEADAGDDAVLIGRVREVGEGRLGEGRDRGARPTEATALGLRLPIVVQEVEPQVVCDRMHGVRHKRKGGAALNDVTPGRERCILAYVALGELEAFR